MHQKPLRFPGSTKRSLEFIILIPLAAARVLLAAVRFLTRNSMKENNFSPMDFSFQVTNLQQSDAWFARI